jgi:hypothetical protein
MASLGEVAEPPSRIVSAPRQIAEEEREALIAKARQRNAQAFAPWSRDEEVRKRYEAGIARAHKRSPRAIELHAEDPARGVEAAKKLYAYYDYSLFPKDGVIGRPTCG